MSKTCCQRGQNGDQSNFVTIYQISPIHLLLHRRCHRFSALARAITTPLFCTLSECTFWTIFKTLSASVCEPNRPLKKFLCTNRLLDHFLEHFTNDFALFQFLNFFWQRISRFDQILDLFLDHFFGHFLDRRPDGKAERPDTGAETSSFLVISMIPFGSKSARTAKVLGPPKG